MRKEVKRPAAMAVTTTGVVAAAGLALLSISAFAADAPTGSSTLDSVIVTGTRAKDRTVLNSTVPIDVLSAEDVRRAAGPDGDLAAALQALLPSFNFPRQSNSGGADHVRAAQLRGMSPDQVLVLVNGKRRHVTAIVNLESKVGKGTNPVDFNSIPLNAIKRIEVLRDGAGAQYGSDAVGGVINILLDDSAPKSDGGAARDGEVEASYGAYHTHFEPTHQTITDGQAATLGGKLGFAIGDGGVVRFGIQGAHHNPTNRAGFDAGAYNNDTADNRSFIGLRNYRAGEPEVEDYQLWVNSRLPLAGDHTAYAFGTYDRRRSIGAAFFRYPDDGNNVKSIYPNGYLPETTGINEDISLAGGVRGPIAADWSYDASLVFGRNNFDYGVRHSLNASLGAASPTNFDLGSFRFDQWTANADVSREITIAALPKPMLLALGAELRRETYRTTAGDPASYALGPFSDESGAQAGPGLQAGDAVDLRRHVYGLYADVSADVTNQLFVDAAARWDHYGDFGSATTGKLSARYALTPDFGLRAALSNNFRAPSLAQTGFRFTVTDRGAGGALTQVQLLPVDDPLARRLGAQELKAESSHNVSLGLTAQPAAGLTMSLDAYRIDVDNRITLSERQDLANGNAANFFTNAVDTRTQGIDFVANWLHPLAGGELKLSLASSFNKTTIRDVHGSGAVGLEERNTLTDASPRSRHVLTTQWTGQPWTLLARATRHGATTRVFDFGGGFTPTQTYSAKWQLDLEAELALTRQLSVTVGGVNVGDTYPSRSIDDITYFGNLPYDVLSPIGFNGAFYYARLRYAF